MNRNLIPHAYPHVLAAVVFGLCASLAWAGTELRDEDGNIILEDIDKLMEEMQLDTPVDDSVQASTGDQEKSRDRKKRSSEITIRGQKTTVKELRESQRATLATKAETLRTTQAADLAKAHEYSWRFGAPSQLRREDGGAAYPVKLVNGKPIYYTSFNLNAAKTVSTDDVWPGGSAGLSLDGDGYVIGLWDEGAVRTTHQEFTFGGFFPTRVTQKDTATNLIPHSTRVAGTLVSVGGFPDSKGMSFDGDVHAYDFFFDSAEIADAILSNDLRVSNHSYGIETGWEFDSGLAAWVWHGDLQISTNEDYVFGFYTEGARIIDDLAYNANYFLPVRSAGNERDANDLGPASQPVFHYIPTTNGFIVTNLVHNSDGDTGQFDTLPPNGAAKNNLTVGAVDDIPAGYSTNSDVVLAAFTSFGPTDDGRIKPDLVANGLTLTTTDSSGDNVYVFGDFGTSFSAPNVAGSLNLLIELYTTLYGTNRPMLASTLKGLAIHTADEAGSAPGPDYRFGWGLFNTRKAAQVITNDFAAEGKAHIKEVVLTDGDYIEFPIESDGTEPLRVTICWTDPPGTVPTLSVDPTNLVLVNDLDLRLVPPSGTSTNMPWVLDPANPTNAATTGDNFRDNVEQVHIGSPTSGLYTVRVTHKGSLSNDHQNVSIIISGNIPELKPELELVDFFNDTVPTNVVEWPSVVGQLYRVQVSDDLLSGVWDDASADISATKTNVIHGVDTNALPEFLFYRIVEID